MRDLLTDPIYDQDCSLCKYACDCTVVGPCPIGGPILDNERKKDAKDLKGDFEVYKTGSGFSIDVVCPDKFDEDNLACFWCDVSDVCRGEEDL